MNVSSLGYYGGYNDYSATNQGNNALNTQNPENTQRAREDANNSRLMDTQSAQNGAGNNEHNSNTQEGFNIIA